MVSKRTRSASRPDTKKARAIRATARAKPGTRGMGKYYRIEVRPSSNFVDFRYHDVGRPGHVLRLAGRRASGSWADVAWLISKDDAHVRDGRLVTDEPDARKVLETIGPASHVKGDVFRGHPRKNVPERLKPTPAQAKARSKNIAKAQKARTSKA